VLVNCNTILFSMALGLLGCRARGANDPVEKPSTVQTGIDITPKRSIGKVVLGSKVDQLPKGAIVSGVAGELDGVHFLIQDARVEDVWIEDLRKFPVPVRFAGRTIARDTPLAELKALFGSCQEVAVKGGGYFNCSAGIAIGTDSAQQGEFVQLRLKPR